MKTYPMKRVTIVCEALARDPLRQVLKDVGAHGFTAFSVEGEGSQGLRPADIAEFANIQMEVVVQPAVAETLMKRLEEEFFPRFAMIAYLSDIEVLRPQKF